MTDLTLLTAREAARHLTAGTLRSEELVRAYLDRIAEREPVVNAWEALDPDRAVAEAQARDRTAVRGPLHGLPVGIKDVIDTADMPTAYGSPIYAGHRPSTDAACVALMRDAGAVVLGKTVSTEFATFCPGKTANPHDPDVTPGGSSSGSAAAVADRMVPLAFGTQTAGSIVRPASFCGAVGYKPTYGTINRVGVKMIADSLDTVGVFARSVDDAAFFVSVLASRPRLLDRDDAAPPTIGLYRTPEWAKAEAATEAALAGAVDALVDAGARIVEVAAPAVFDGLTEAQSVIMDFEIARCLAPERLAHGGRISPQLRRNFEAGLSIGVEEYDRARDHAVSARASLDALFGGCDALLVPAAPGEAPRGLAATGDAVFNRMWTLLHVPCVAVPAGRGPNGLPVGVQMVGRVGDDRRALQAAAFLERALMACGRA